MSSLTALSKRVFTSPVIGSLALEFCSAKDVAKVKRAAKCFCSLAHHAIDHQLATRKCVSLQELEDFQKQLKVSLVDVLNKMPDLEEINFSSLKNSLTKVIAEVKACKHVGNWTKLGGLISHEQDMLRIATSFPSLEYYNFTNSAVGNETLVAFSKGAPHLKGVTLHYRTMLCFNEIGMNALRINCPKLECLTIISTEEFSPAFARSIAAFGENLKHLSLKSVKNPEQVLALVSKGCPNLLSVELDHTTVWLNGLLCLSNLKKLEVIKLGERIAQRVSYTPPCVATYFVPISFPEFGLRQFCPIINNCSQLKMIQFAPGWISSDELMAMFAYTSVKNPMLEIR